LLLHTKAHPTVRKNTDPASSAPLGDPVAASCALCAAVPGVVATGVVATVVDVVVGVTSEICVKVTVISPLEGRGRALLYKSASLCVHAPDANAAGAVKPYPSSVSVPVEGLPWKSTPPWAELVLSEMAIGPTSQGSPIKEKLTDAVTDSLMVAAPLAAKVPVTLPPSLSVTDKG